MKIDKDLIRRFCTPPFIPFSELENRTFADAEKINFSFEGEILAGYSWGTGKTVLLVHGWGSRASHMALLGRFLAKAGFRAIVYDAPAHSSTTHPLKKTASNLFEYCRAISAVSNSIGPIFAIIGHSFGAACAAFTVRGISAFSEFKISADKLILISTPPKLADVYRSFCRRDIIGEEGLDILKNTLENEFLFSSEDYTMQAALKDISADILLIHDNKDEEFPVSDIYALQNTIPQIKVFITDGSGHQKIIGNRLMMARVKEYLLNNEK
jgi:esterase/lipase